MLSTKTVRTERARAVRELRTALQSAGYACTEEPSAHSIVLQCEHERGPVAVEIRTDIELPALSFRYWVPNEHCGTPEFLARMESYNLADRSGGTRTYCVGNKMVFEFEALLPGQGIEANEIGPLLSKWQTVTLGEAANPASLRADDAENDEDGVKQ